MTAFLDTNILIYLLDPEAQFHTWSVEQLQSCKANGPAVVSDIVTGAKPRAVRLVRCAV